MNGETNDYHRRESDPLLCDYNNRIKSIKYIGSCGADARFDQKTDFSVNVISQARGRI